MNERPPQIETTSFKPDLVAYSCINCGRSLEGPGECPACGTFYKPEGFSLTSSIGDEPIYVKVNPDFPERGFGGSKRDQEKENAVETDVFKRLEAFLGSGDEKKINFMWKLINASAKNGASILRVDSSDIKSYLKAQNSKDGNQVCFLRLLPELMTNNNVWTEVVTSVLSDQSIDIEEYKRFKKELEIAMGFLVPLEETTQTISNTQIDTDTKSETKPNTVNSFWNRIVSIFRGQ